jgi:hypothetical protein
MDDTTYSSSLSIGSNLVYWYDEDGNICSDDPDENSTQKAFLIQDNGLYKANEKWTEYKNVANNNLYYANLSAYEVVGNNLVVANGGAQHAYSEKDADGNVIAFYGDGNGNYFADKEMKVKVLNLADITKENVDDESKPLPYRYLANEEKTLMAKVEDTDGKWVTVTFYIHTGDLAKNYRLEVWSGSRDNATVNASTDAADSYVMFDTNNPGSAESNFSALIEEKKDVEDAVMFESVFSYNDSASFLPYNKALDTDKVGNLYADDAGRSEGVAYLAFSENGNQTVFADYQYSEITIIAQTPEEEEDDTTTSDTDTETTDETNVAMLFSSIAIAAVLVFVIITVAVRKLLKKLGKLPKKSFAPKAKKEKKEKKVKAEKTEEPKAPKAEEETNEDSPYND